MSNIVNDSIAGETELEALAVCSTMVGGGGGVYKTEKEELEESHSLQSSHFFQPTESGGDYESRILSSKSDTGHNLYTSE